MNELLIELDQTLRANLNYSLGSDLQKTFSGFAIYKFEIKVMEDSLVLSELMELNDEIRNELNDIKK